MTACDALTTNCTRLVSKATTRGNTDLKMRSNSKPDVNANLPKMISNTKSFTGQVLDLVHVRFITIRCMHMQMYHAREAGADFETSESVLGVGVLKHRKGQP